MSNATSIPGKRRRKSARRSEQVFSDLQSLQREVQALKLQITHLESTLTADAPTEEEAYRVPQFLSELKPRRQPSPGKTAMQMVQGQWPGEETTEQLLAQLKAFG